MKNLIILFSILFLGCNKQLVSEQDLTKGIPITFKVTKIETTENAYFIDCERKDEQTIKLVSWKRAINDCKEELKVGESYTLNLKFEEFMAGDYDGYQYDGKFFPLETLIAFSKDLEGLCIVK